MFKQTFISLALLLPLAAPAHAMIGGTPIADVEHSGMVSLQTGPSTCGAVVLTPDTLLGSAICFGGSVVQHPELIGWFMGSQDSDGNPVREVILDRASNFALIRLSHPLVGATTFSLYRGQASDVHNLRCVSFGPRALEVFPTGATLSYADYTVSGPPENLALGGPVLTSFDSGGACFTVDGTNQVAAIIKSRSVVLSTTLARAFVTEARTTFEIVSQASNLCIGNAANSTSVRQSTCLPGGNYDRLNQQWVIRRIFGFDNRIQLRSLRFPDYCLGPANASTAEGAAVTLSPCAPDIVDPLPLFLPTQARPEQLWDVAISGGDTLRLVNGATFKCLDIAGGSTALGVALVQSSCSTTAPTQRFLVDADRFPAGTHRLAAWADTAQCMDVSFAATWWGAAIGSWFCDGSDKQRFDLTSVDGTPRQYVQRAWLGNITCLAVPGGDVTPGVGVMQWPCGPWGDHHWLFRWTPDLFGYRVRPEHAPSLCLTRPPLAPSAQLIQATCDPGFPSPGYNAQRWVVE